MSKKKKIKQKLKEGERRLVAKNFKKSNTLPNRINPKYYYIQKYNDT